MQRHTGGGTAVRTITCLPALTGAWRDAAGGLLLTTGDFYGMNTAALERPDLLKGRRPRTINTSGDRRRAARGQSAGARRCSSTTPIPVTVRPDSEKVMRGFSREDLFTVVHDIFLTDTADYADIVLPATTQLEYFDVPQVLRPPVRAANQPAIAPVGEALPNTEVFRASGRAHGLRPSRALRDRTRTSAARRCARAIRAWPASTWSA